MTSPIVSRIPSGINEVDQLWSGFYRGGTYLVYGRTADGRSVLPLMFASEGCRRNEKCLFVATDRPRSLVILSSLIDFDIKAANSNNLLKLVRFPTLSESRGISDDVRADTLAQLVTHVREFMPTRLVINDLSPFVQFESFDRFRSELVALLDQLDSLNITTIFALPEPANVHSERVVSFLKSQVVGSLHVQRQAGNASENYTLSLIPNVGHITKEYTIDWHLESVVDQRLKQDASQQPDVIAQPSPPTDVPIADTAPAATDSTGLTQESDDSADDAPDDIVEQWHASLPSVEPVLDLGEPRANEDDAHHGSTEKRGLPEEPDKESRDEEESSTSIDDEFDDTLHSDSRPKAASEQKNADEFGPSHDDASESGDEEYESQIISDLNRELIGLVQPFEIIGGKKKPLGAINPEIHRNKDSFVVAADFHFDTFEREETPFLLLGIRLDRTRDMIPRKFDFEFVAEITQQLLRSYDSMLIEEESEHLVILLAGAQQNGADAFFRRLRDRLLAEAPNQASHLMASVSAIIAVNGEGFKSTSDFLRYILASGD